MVQIYYKLVTGGKMTIDKVPSKWRTAVQALIDANSPKEEENN